MDNNIFTIFDIEKATQGKWTNLTVDKNVCSRVSKITTDSRENCEKSLFIALKGSNFDGHNFIQKAIENGAVMLCVENAYKGTVPAHIPVYRVKDTLVAYQELARYHRLRLENIIIVGITGSNGKTTTKEILKNILEKEFGVNCVYATKANTNNFIGVPQNLLNLREEHKYAVIEMGTNHPGEINVLASIAIPNIAIITSIGSSHLEFFNDINGVAKEKSNIFNYFSELDKKNTTAIIPFDTLKYEDIFKSTRKNKLITFGMSESSDISYKVLESTPFKTRFSMKDVKKNITAISEWEIIGVHHISNAAAAVSAAVTLGMPLAKAVGSLSDSRLTGMRMKANTINNSLWINDAYNANPDSTEAGLRAIKNFITNSNFSSLFLVLGDMLELGKKSLELHKELIHYTNEEIHNANIILVGEIMQKAAISLKESGYKTENNLKYFATPQIAAEYIKENLKENALVYLKGSRGVKLETIEDFYLSHHNK